MFQTEREDWRFVVSATVVFAIALVVALWDFVVIQKMIYRFGVLNVTGLVLFLIGISIRVVGRITFGKTLFIWSEDLTGSKARQTWHLQIHSASYFSRCSNLHRLDTSCFCESVRSPMMLFLIPLFLYRLRIEEKMLIDRFGDEYREYMRKTKKMIPFVY